MRAAPAYIYLEWIGTGAEEPGLLGDVREQLERTFELPTRIGRIRDRPHDAYDPVRGQYLSTRILRWLLEHVPADARTVIGITDRDLFIAVLTYVFGEAQVGGTGAVVSTARLRLDPAGLPAERGLLRARLLKECVHEVGHTFGLVHCHSASCVMSRSNTIVDVDSKPGDLCANCRGRLQELRAKEAV